MNLFHRPSPRGWLLVGLVAAAVLSGCAAAATPSPSQSNSSAPAKLPALPGVVPTIVQSIESKLAATAMPTIAPTAVPAKASTPQPTAAPTLAATAEPTQTFGALGMPEPIADLLVLPQQVNRVNQIGQDQPKAGDTYLQVMVFFTNTSQAADVQFDPATFMIEDTSTHKTYSLAVLKTQTDQVQAQMLKPGAQVKGLITFEVPQSATTKLELELSTASHTLYWTIGA